MITLSCSDLSYVIGVTDILTSVSFSLESGDRLGVVGVNGSGKSTLLRLISGELEASGGTVYIARDKTLGVLHQNDAFNILPGYDDTVYGQMLAAFPELHEMEARLAELDSALHGDISAEEAIRLSGEYDRTSARYSEGGGLYYRSRCRTYLTRMGFPEELHTLPVSNLSGGQRTRLAIARLLSREPDILLLDEPTNHLDVGTLEFLEEALSGYKKTLITVSHDRYFLDRVTNKTLEIEYHRAKLYNASYTGFKEQKKKDFDVERKHFELQEKEIARLEAYIEQQRRWNRERNIIAAESREKAIARIERLDKPKSPPKGIKLQFSASGESGNDVLRVRGLRLAYGEKELFGGLDFDVKKRDRVFITGANGSGKSTLIKLLLGQIPPDAGLIEYGYNVTVGYYDQENQNLTPENTVLDELWNAYPDITRTEIRSTLAQFNFRGDAIEKRVADLSGGECARLTLAKLILSRMNLLILDEPTNHLDVDSREALEEALLSFPGTLILVSHDRYFVEKLSDRKHGDFRRQEVHLTCRDDVTGLGQAVRSRSETDGKSETGADSFREKKQSAADIRRRDAEIRKMRAEAARIEARIAEIDEASVGEAAADYVKLAELTDEKNALEERLLEIYEVIGV